MIKESVISKTGRAIVFALFLMVVAASPTISQSNGGSSSGYTAGQSDQRDGGTDWGRLGLLGLAGLLGLVPKKRTADSDNRVPTGTGARASSIPR